MTAVVAGGAGMGWSSTSSTSVESINDRCKSLSCATAGTNEILANTHTQPAPRTTGINITGLEQRIVPFFGDLHPKTVSAPLWAAAMSDA